MNIFDNIYKNRLQESEKNIKFWEDYLQNLTSLDFNTYSDKLTVPILVPIGNKILFRGSLKHTNEVTVALGADYFTKCSTNQAEVLRQHRIKDAKSKLEELNKERDYLESQISFSKGIIHGNQGQDIIEECSEEEDKAWREKHREKVREYYQNREKKDVEESNVTDEELWTRLEELELQEELENEMAPNDDQNELDDSDKNEYDSFIIKKDDVSNIQAEQTNDRQDVPQITHNFPKHTSNVDLLLQVIDRQKMLEEKLSELKNREKVQTKTESDLLSRLDEMEQLDELEDEMDRLDEIILEDEEVVDDSIKSDNSPRITRSVSFADQDNSETIEITFQHSNVEPSKEPYDPEKGITKPSDVYKAYSTLFGNEATSILKESKYENIPVHNFYEDEAAISTEDPQYASEIDDTIKTIIIKDVVEKSDTNGNKVQYDTRPSSLFKKKRQQQKLNAIQQNENHVGLFYTMNNDLCKQLFTHGGLPKSFTKQTKTFTETALMVRLPALDIINCIKATDFDKPAIRYVLYGEKGTGKSLTLAHLLHYAHEDGFLIVHIPWVSEWLRRVPRHKEMSNSQTKEGFVDIPLDAAAWLLHFKMQNQVLLKTGDLKISKEYVWSKREKTVEGAPLADLVEHGIARVKYACDVIEVLIKEIKLLSESKKCKTFVAIDGFNSFFYPLTRLRTPTKKKVTPEEVSLTAPFMDITKNDWSNGVVVLTTDVLAVPEDRQESYFPKYLLYQKGFEHLDPFVPVEIGRYTEREFISCANYYRDRLWMRGPPELESELKLASTSNNVAFSNALSHIKPEDHLHSDESVKCGLLDCLCILFVLSNAILQGTVDVKRLQGILEEGAKSKDAGVLYYSLKGLTLLKAPIPDVCDVISKINIDLQNIEQVFYLTNAAELSGCQNYLKPDILGPPVATLDKKDATLADIYHAIYSMKALGKGTVYDREDSLKNLIQILKKDDTPANYGYVFAMCEHMGCGAWTAAHAESALLAADETDSKVLHFDGGLPVTSFVLSTILRTYKHLKKPSPLTEEQRYKFAAYLLSRRSVTSPRGAALLLEAALHLADEQPTPISIVFKDKKYITSESDTIEFSVTDLVGRPVPNLKPEEVVAQSGTRLADDVVVLSKQPLTQKPNEQTTFVLNLSKIKAQHGLYKISLSAGAKSANFNVAVLGEIVVSSVEIGVGDVDGTTSPRLTTVMFPNKLAEKLQADHLQKVSLKFSVRDKFNKAVLVQQAFVRVAPLAAQEEEAIYVAEPDNSKTYKVDLNVGAISKHLSNVNGVYSVTLLLGDNAVAAPVSWHLADLALHFGKDANALGESVKSAPVGSAYRGPLPEVSHTFREAEARPPRLVSDVFACACAAPLLLLLILWARLGLNFSLFPFSPSALLFHAGLGGSLSLYALLWLQLSMFDTLRYLLPAAALTFLSGHRLLRRLATQKTVR
ncbi:uncharacterized protein [Maniola hyperantus]|uniref:uncharacterized protein n=1 Tax=Aphantopus hyperantus TaxID=2795564 RepID=UPI00374947BC